MRNCIFIMFLSLSLSVTAFAYDWSANPGDGSIENPYQISEANHLMSIGADANLLDKHYILMNDIVFDPNNNPDHVFDRALIAPDTDPNRGDFQGSYFTGSFDGANYKIISLVIDTSGKNEYLGLFGLVSGSPVSNLGIEEGYIDGSKNIGMLAGYTSGSVENCYSSGVVRADIWGGGLIGFSRGDSLDCYSSSLVSGGQRLGGLIGTCVSASITNCYATGSVTGSGERIGGLVGRNYRCDVANSYATGDVEGDFWVGGLLGVCFDSIVSQNYAIGDVNGRRDVGGLVGYYYSKGEVSNSYATGAVSGEMHVGGLVGYNEVTVSRCYTIGSVDGNQTVGCLVGYNFHQEGYADGFVSDCFWLINSPTPGVGGNSGTVVNVSGKTAEQMQMQTTFTNSPANWDFVGDSNGNNDIWRMCDQGRDYPRLWWEFPMADMACPDGVDLNDFAMFGSYFSSADCNEQNNWCHRCDFDLSNSVDLNDLYLLTEYWLWGLPPSITNWEISVVHGAVGEIVIPISDGYVEPRSAGIVKLIVSFDQAMDTSVEDINLVTITGVNGGVQGSPCSVLWDSGDRLEITLCSALPDEDSYTVSLDSGFVSAAGAQLAGDRDICVIVLAGDANKSRSVNAQDLLAIRARASESIDEGNVQYDINCNGSINAQDLLSARSHAGSTAPGCQ